MGILLFFVALWLFSVLLIPAIVHTIVGAIRWKGKFKFINNSFLNGALALDIAGNVMFASLLNDWFVKRGAYLYGDPCTTISSVTGINYQSGCLNWLGIGLCVLLNIVDFKNWKHGGHCWISTPPKFREGKTPKKWTKDLLYLVPFLFIVMAVLYASTKLFLWLI